MDIGLQASRLIDEAIGKSVGESTQRPRGSRSILDPPSHRALVSGTSLSPLCVGPFPVIAAKNDSAIIFFEIKTTNRASGFDIE